MQKKCHIVPLGAMCLWVIGTAAILGDNDEIQLRRKANILEKAEWKDVKNGDI